MKGTQNRRIVIFRTKDPVELQKAINKWYTATSLHDHSIVEEKLFPIDFAGNLMFQIIYLVDGLGDVEVERLESPYHEWNKLKPYLSARTQIAIVTRDILPQEVMRMSRTELKKLWGIGDKRADEIIEALKHWDEVNS